MPLTKNEIYEAVGVGYTSEGLGIARIDGRAVFVRDLIEGETAEIRIIKVGKNAVYGKVEKLVSASPERITPDCPAFGKCGGCATRHMSYKEELSFKRKRVEDAVRRIGGLDIEVTEIIGADSVDGYRNKTIYTLAQTENGVVTGFYRARSHDVVAAPDCNIESDYSRRAAGALRRFMDENCIPVYSPETRRGIRRIMCRYGFKSGEGQIVLVTGKGKIAEEDRLVEALREACPETVSIMRNINADPGDTVLSYDFSLLWGCDHIVDELLDLKFSLAPGAFYQVNRTQAERLYTRAIEYAELNDKTTALDLYCGTGTITLCLARKAGSVVGAEIVESAIENANKNAERNGLNNARFICADATEAAKKLKKEGYTPEVVVVDPPRKGLSPETPAVIASMNPKRVVYVSCDPATLARDLKEFKALGYETEEVTAVDMFPRTHHVESVAKLTRK